MGKVIFSLCVSVHTSTGGGGGSQVQVGGVPNPAMDGGVPGLRFSGEGAGPLSQ